MPSYMDEYNLFAANKMSDGDTNCFFCDSTDAKIFYFLTDTNHKKHRAFSNPEKSKYYYKCCHRCAQTFIRHRNLLVSHLMASGNNDDEVDKIIAGQLDEFLKFYKKHDFESFFNWVSSLSAPPEYTAEVLNTANDSEVLALLPSVISKLRPQEVSFCLQRIEQYKEDFMFNSSSDYLLLINIVLSEVQLQRLQEKMLTSKLDEKSRQSAKKEWLETMKDYRDTLSSLGILRKERDKIGGTNIAEISELIGTDDYRKEIQEWDEEVEQQIEAKKRREEERGF